MSDTIIKVEGLGKKYLIGHEKQERYTALRDVMVNNLKGWGRGVKQMFQKGNDAMVTGDEIEEFWALKDVSFEIKRGDAVGIIGRNGAGKSTLLKLLSRITEPTTGKIEMRGRVASLLEVGTGFHPELTGRENIYLNGAILGMSRHEIKRKFDEIVDFSGVEKFLDTPVKRYSSGMYVRLAFAVAAHLEPEILVVDEVLAVGDAEFQKKCLGKMNDVSQKEGRTVLFVSHNLNSIKKLCNSGIFLKNGQVIEINHINNVINHYLNESIANTNYTNLLLNNNFRYGSGEVRFKSIMINRLDDYQIKEIPFSKPILLEIEFEVYQSVNNAILNVFLDDQLGTRLLLVADSFNNKYISHSFTPGLYRAIIKSNQILLPRNGYTISLFIGRKEDGLPFDYIENVAKFNINSIAEADSDDYIWKYLHGYIQDNAKWDIKMLNSNLND